VAKDEALSYFLGLLKYLRKVLIQDAAVLCSVYPNLPIFRFAPFDTETFKTFSARSTQIIKNAESEARENLKNLPEQYAMSIQGFMKTALLKQELHQTLLEESNSGLRDDIGQLKDVMNAVLVLQGTRTSRGVKQKAMEDLSTLIACAFTDTMVLTFTELTFNEARPVPPPPVPNGACVAWSPNCPKNSAFNPSALGPPMPSIVSPSSSPPPVPVPNGVCIPSLLHANTQSPNCSTNSITSHLHQSQIVVSGNGNIYPITMFPLSQSHPDVQVKQMAQISKLESLFPTERLKQHNFEWNAKRDEWLPFYDFWRPSPGVPPTVDQIWAEYMEGIGNPKSFSILELTANWGGRWKRNIQKIKTESSKRKKVIDLVQALLIQPEWDSTKALVFLREKYPIPSSSSSHPFLKNISAFIAHLQTHKNALSEIVKSSL